jgi:uncharacterized membrane protein YfcA
MHELLHSIRPGYSLSGFVVGTLVGLTGVGGGALMTPLLVILFGIRATTAVGTDLLYACVTKTVGTAVHGFSGTVEWPIVRRLAAGSVPFTALTLVVLAHYRNRLDSGSNVITTVLGFALILTAISIVFRKRILNALAEFSSKLSPRGTTLLTISLGAALGVLVSLSSVGAGAIGVTFLLILYPKLPASKLVGSDIAHAVPLTLIAGIGHWFLGSIDGVLLVSLLVGSIPGVIIGSYISARIPDKVLRPVLAGTLAVVGARLSF